MSVALSAEPVTAVMTASSGRTCPVALHVKSHQPVPVVLSMSGSGLYVTTAQPVPLWFAGRVERGELAVLVFDKPGVMGLDEEGGVEFEPETFAAYTPDDLVDCARAALSWAIARDDIRQTGHVVVGHSEGALVAASLAAAALDQGQTELFATVVLSGFPVRGVKAAMEHQHGGRLERGMRQYKKEVARDLESAVRKAPFMGVATMEAWWARGLEDGPVTTVLQSRTPVLVQHGLADQAVPVDWITTWAADYVAPWLVVQLFDAGHDGSLTSLSSQTVWIDHFLGLDPAHGFVGAYRNDP